MGKLRTNCLCGVPTAAVTHSIAPRYILDVLLSVIRLSVETVEVVKGLPNLNL